MPGQKTTIVSADPQAGDRLTQIAHAAKAQWGYSENWILSWTAELTITREYIESHPTFVALHEKRIVGFFALQMRAKDVSLDHLWVLPTDSGKGIGRPFSPTPKKSHAKAVRGA